MPLANPWPPTPPQGSPSPSSLVVNDPSWNQEVFTPSTSCVSYGRDLDNAFVLNGFFHFQQAGPTR